MPSCCDGEGYDAVFTDRFARRVARRYRRHGLNATSSRMVDFLSRPRDRGCQRPRDRRGSGEIQLELLRRGAARVTNLEISTSYEEEARDCSSGPGMTGRVTRRFLDIAQAPDEVEPADVVVLHRVVCCYPDYEALLSAAGATPGGCWSSATHPTTPSPAVPCGRRTCPAGSGTSPSAPSRTRWTRCSRCWSGPGSRRATCTAGGPARRRPGTPLTGPDVA